ncbi:MAG TPA: hypothetical protein VFE62_16990, partial [Gemmataceae bacterium]|nr:hypothetical protein [Gemmataceae bacterium]
MMAFGFVEILVLALLAGGMDNNELVAVVQPKDYFESRNVRMSIDSMIDVAIREPKDGKAQIMQLSALRYLMDESDAFKKASNYASNREAIEEIATGKRAQDKAGFSKEYAQRLLNKLDGKKATAPKKQPLRANAFEWFPDDISLAGALDLRGDGNSDSLKAMLKMLPAREKHQLYAAIENIGNLRIDRVAFGYSDGAERGDGRFYLRMTGKGSHDGLMQLLGQVDGRMQPTEIKPADGAKITLLQSPNNRTPSIVLVGDTDFLLVSAERAGPKARQEDLVQAVLDVRAKKKTSAAEGPFKKRLAKLPEKAVGFVVGEFPGPLKGELQNEFGAVPTNGLVHIERGAQALELHA